MSDLRLNLLGPQNAVPLDNPRPFGRHLIQNGTITQADLIHALQLQRHVDAPIGEILHAKGLVDIDGIVLALSEQFGMSVADLSKDPSDPALAAMVPSSLCMKYRAIPWLRLENVLVIATSRPDQFEDLKTCLGAAGKQLIPVIAKDKQVMAEISRIYGPELAQKAETKVPAKESCRTWQSGSTRNRTLSMAALLITFGICLWAPLETFTALMLFAFATLLMTTLVKAAAFWAQLSPQLSKPVCLSVESTTQFRLPKVSVLVPLLHEKEIAGALVKRLQRLTYPKSLLDVVLVLEEEDEITKKTLSNTDLPDWINVIEVPKSDGLTTKPRALNYALDFCQGSIIGVWDAEDAPEPDQLEQVVTAFHQAPDNVACLQGILDYYNPRANLMARCFTIEYATWWRLVMPGMAKLGLVVPLGGTTLFFRRDILEELGGWDAHNVTEDADLGLRLARHGYVTELIPTVTYEEANCRPWRWVRQRSRWLKGFLVTWCVHMRNPIQLWRDLGPVRFFGVQTIFFATFVQFAMMPLMWSFWIYLLGVTHPVSNTLGADVAWGMAFAFLLAEILSLLISCAAVSGHAHRHLLPYVLLMPFYFSLGALAAAKALLEIFQKPFFWDKTQHGVTASPDAEKPNVDDASNVIAFKPAGPVLPVSAAS